MYPKFGFSRVAEYEYFKPINTKCESQNITSLDMELTSNRDMLYYYVKNSAVFGKNSMRDNADLVMFYCTSLLRKNIYYIKPLDIIIIATFTDNQLLLWDAFGSKKIDLDTVINSVVTSKIKEILLGFTPEDCRTYHVREIFGDDVLFIQEDKTKLFKENKLMFPLLSHA